MTQANSIYTTFNEDFQYDLQCAIHGFNVVIVVLEVDTGRILGLASSPTFDPNLLDYVNYNSSYSADALYGPERPMYNRASQGQYPLGSVFKTIVMAAALESGLYTVESEMDCPYEWTGLEGITLYDWTKEHEAEQLFNITPLIVFSLKLPYPSISAISDKLFPLASTTSIVGVSVRRAT